MKPQYWIVFIFMLVSADYVNALNLQVPDSCILKKSYPCLIKTSKAFLKFDVQGSAISLGPKSILKIEKVNSDESNIQLIQGRLMVEMDVLPNESVNNQKKIKINGLEINNQKRVFISRQLENIELLGTQSFLLEQYRQAERKGVLGFSVEKSTFLDKRDFVEYVKVFFNDRDKFKIFLFDISKDWKVQFKKQNDIQTKVLRSGRSIASEDKTPILTSEDLTEDEEIKKVRERFFFRTFHR